MTGSIITLTLRDGRTKRYKAAWRAGGKQKRKTFKRRKDAERFLATVVKSVHEGSWQEVKPALMRDVFRAWLSDLDTRQKLGEIKPSTAASYRSGVKRHFNPALGDYRSDQLTASVMKKWRAELADKVASGAMSQQSFNNLLTLLRSILGWARAPAQRYMSHDPLVGQKRLRIQRCEATFLEDSDMDALLTAADEPEASAIIHVGLFAGLRRGEIFGLEWDDLEVGDGEVGGRIRVRRAVWRGTISTPKSKLSERTVDVPQRVLDVLAAHRATCPPMGPGFVFRTPTGQPMGPDAWYAGTFCKIRKSAGLPPTVGLHSLRHTYASLLIRQGENPKYVSRQLGHASTSFTMDSYAHLFVSTSNEAMRRLNEMIPVPARKLRVVGGAGGGASTQKVTKR